MSPLPRTYTTVLRAHFQANRQMAFVAGPRQVGKTMLCRTLDTKARYLDLDDKDDRALILKGPKAVATRLDLTRLGNERPLVVFDEIHKHARWKTFLKGFFDKDADQARILVPGSSRLDVYRRGGPA